MTLENFAIMMGGTVIIIMSWVLVYTDRINVTVGYVIMAIGAIITCTGIYMSHMESQRLVDEAIEIIRRSRQ